MVTLGFGFGFGFGAASERWRCIRRRAPQHCAAVPPGDGSVVRGSAFASRIMCGAVAVAIVVVVSWHFLKCRVSLALQAIYNDETVSMGMGINSPRYFALT
jgi:branched-subunit amino acid ABC-type transport system permease component